MLEHTKIERERGVGGVAILIPAHDEAGTIGESVRWALQAASPADRVCVIADHCADDTAARARAAGARVYERADGPPGKGAALAWLLETAAADFASADALVVLDADSRLHAGSLPALTRALDRGAAAAQGFVRPVPDERSVATLLAAYNEWLAQAFDDRLRQFLGWSVPLRGTGMALRPAALRAIAPALRTRVEDVELTLLLATRGARIAFVPEAVVEDPKPSDDARLARQRARWLQGQREVWRLYGGSILELVATGGPGAWSLLGALLLKPRTALIVAKPVALVALTPFAGVPAVRPLRVGLGAWLALDGLYYTAGLAVIPRAWRRPMAWALLRAPLYAAMWARALIWSVTSREAWLRARD